MAKPAFMRERASVAPQPAAGDATVVFVRPSGYASTQLFRIIDDQGRFIGDSRASSWFAVHLPAGRHVFVAHADNTAPMVANLAAGRVYFVEVAAKMGVMSARVHLYRLAPGTENWPNVRQWLGETQAYEPDFASGQTSVDAKADDVQELIRRAHEHLGNYDAEMLQRVTLRENDGVLAY